MKDETTKGSEQTSRWWKLDFLTKYWKSHDDINLEKIEEKIVALKEKKKELIASKDSSPTHSDPEVQKERDRYFYGFGSN